MKAVELFAGAGGLALGTAHSGFSHHAVLEWNHDACQTIRANQNRGLAPVNLWPLHEVDVNYFDFKSLGKVDLISGGPPCQPFSVGGKHKGPSDNRNLFHELVRAVRETRPKAILIENVRGLLRPAFTSFFEYILLQLRFPELAKHDGEEWKSHLNRLEKHQTRGGKSGISYNLVFQCLNAADYGVPQKRHRVFIVGFRSDLRISWSFPIPTHSQDALLYAKYISGDYWDEHKVPTNKRVNMPVNLQGKIKRLKSSIFPPTESRWLTVRDALQGLPEPTIQNSYGIANHTLNPGARAYNGHTGSPHDEPAKALKAGDHGVPGGENMLAYSDGTVRYFTVRESARLQTFPDTYHFNGSWSESMRQLGNAVPVRLAQTVAESIYARLL